MKECVREVGERETAQRYLKDLQSDAHSQNGLMNTVHSISNICFSSPFPIVLLLVV